MTAERGLRFRGAEVEWSGGGSGESRDFHDTEKLRYLENRSCDGRVHRKSRLSIESVLTNSSSSRPESPHRTIPLSGRPPTSPGSPREGGILQIAENRDKSPELGGSASASSILRPVTLGGVCCAICRVPCRRNSGFQGGERPREKDGALPRCVGASFPGQLRRA